MLKLKFDLFFVTSFLCSLEWLLFYLKGYLKRCQRKKNEIFPWLSFWDIMVKPMYPRCDLDLWSLKVMILISSHYVPISVWYKFQVDICIIGWAIKCLNFQNLLSLIIARFVSMATKNNRLTDFYEICRVSSCIPSGSAVKISEWLLHNCDR